MAALRQSQGDSGKLCRHLPYQRDRAVELETLLTVKTAEIEKLRAELASRALDIEPRPERRATPSNAAKRAVSNLRAEIRTVIENDIRAELAAALVRGQ